MLKTSNCYNVPAAVHGSDRPNATMEKSEQYKSHQLMPLSQTAAASHNDSAVGQHHSVFSFDAIELFSGLGNDWPPLQVVSTEATEDTTMESHKLQAKPKMMPDPQVSIATKTVATVVLQNMPVSRPQHTRRTHGYSQEQWNRLVAYCQYDPYEPKQTKLSSMEFDLLVGGAKVDADNYHCQKANEPRWTVAAALEADNDFCELIEHSETESKEMPTTLKRSRETVTNDESWFGFLDEPLTKVGNFGDASPDNTTQPPVLMDEPDFLTVLQATEEENEAFYSMSDADLEDMFLDMLNEE
jgi:hypothetical protein